MIILSFSEIGRDFILDISHSLIHPSNINEHTRIHYSGIANILVIKVGKVHAHGAFRGLPQVSIALQSVENSLDLKSENDLNVLLSLKY